MRTLKTLNFLIGIIIILFGINCKTTVITSSIQYTIGEAEFTYSRPEVVNPGTSLSVHLNITKTPGNVHLLPETMIEIGEDEFIYILIGQKFAYDANQEDEIEHEAYVSDAKLYNGTYGSQFNAYGLDVKIKGFITKKRVVNMPGTSGHGSKMLFSFIPEN